MQFVSEHALVQKTGVVEESILVMWYERGKMLPLPITNKDVKYLSSKLHSEQ